MQKNRAYLVGGRQSVPADRTAAIRFDVRLHELGEEVSLPYPMKRALAWWIAAEMIRRHPDDIRVIENHPGGGAYDCVSLYRRDTDQPIVLMNLEGHITHQPWFDNPDFKRHDEVDDPRFNWLEVLASENRRRYVIETLEEISGFTSPKKTPTTVQKSIGPRLIGRFAAAAAFTTRTWHIRNAYFDSSGMWSGVNDWARDISGPKFERLEDDFLGIPHYRYWFVLDHKSAAAAAVDVDRGLAWRRDRPDVAYDLMDLYSTYASGIDRVMTDVCPAIE